MSTLTRFLDLLWPTRPETWQESLARLGPALANMARLSAASTIAYLLIRSLVHGPIDLTAALTALLVMQASAAGSFKEGILKVVGVSSGVGLALLATGLVGMSWWSLGLVIFSALLLARLLNLGAASLELPISAMLILGSVGRGDVAAETRVLGTLVGTLVGVVFPLVLPPAVPFRSASAAVRRVASAEKGVLDGAAEAMERGPITRPLASAWIARTRQLVAQIQRANEQVDRLNEVRRYNSRAVGTADASPILLSGLSSLESCLTSLRAIFQLIERRSPVVDHPSLGAGHEPQRVFSERVQAGVARVMREMGDCIDAFGAMVEAEANGNEQAAHEAFAGNYRRLRDARAELSSLMGQQDEFTERWLLGGSILAALDAVLQQLDVDARVRVRERWKASQLGRRRPEDNIGPRSSSLDRYRLERMRARWRRHGEPTGVDTDFMGDDEITQELPPIRPDMTPAEARRRRARQRGWTPPS